MALRKIRIVQSDPHGRPSGLDVYDAETGEKIPNVYRVEVDLTRNDLAAHVRLTLGVEWEYEGVAQVEETGARLAQKARQNEIPVPPVETVRGPLTAQPSGGRQSDAFADDHWRGLRQPTMGSTQRDL
jgi:hypothetical protein